MSPQPDVSIVLCTKDRARLLQSALASLLELRPTKGGVELVLVDNGSTDDTKAVVEGFRLRAPFVVRYVYESKPGLSAARNRGIREAEGRYVFFTDDDQHVDPDAAREHLRVAQKYGSRAQQGAIALKFETTRPAWLRGRLVTVLGETADLPEGPANIHMYGGNMFFERALFEEMPAFREDLGKGTAGYSEDIEISLRLRCLGIRVVYAPTARIYHVIDEVRASAAFFRRNSYDKGYSDGLLQSPNVRLLPALLKNGGLAIANGYLSLFNRLRRNAYATMLAETRVADRAGRVAGLLKARVSK
jgi:glycosyltransferase involved in cell wall biosynthesis